MGRHRFPSLSLATNVVLHLNVLSSYPSSGQLNTNKTIISWATALIDSSLKALSISPSLVQVSIFC